MEPQKKSDHVLVLEQDLQHTEHLIISINISLEQLREQEVNVAGFEYRPAVIAALVKAQEEAHKLRIEQRQFLNALSKAGG